MDEAFDWTAVRRAMLNRVKAASLRELARELGDMSPSGLQNFLDGAFPRRKGPAFAEWFLREGARWLGEPDTVLDAAIEVVIAHASPNRRDEVRAYLHHATGDEPSPSSATSPPPAGNRRPPARSSLPPVAGARL